MTDTNPAAGGLSREVEQACVDASLSPRWVEDLAPRLERIIAARTEAADRELARVTAAVEALADEWETAHGDPPVDPSHISVRHSKALRAALSSADTGALDRASWHHRCTCGIAAGWLLTVEHEADCPFQTMLDARLDRERAKAAGEALREARDDIKARIETFRDLDASPDYLDALNDAWGLVANRHRAAAVSPEGGDA